jgi:hypothetical protein
MISAIDTFILERIYTPFAHSVEIITGRTNFFLAWLAFGLAFAGSIANEVLVIAHTHQLPHLADIPLMAVALYMLGRCIIEADKENKRSRAGTRAAIAKNRFLEIGKMVRILALLMALNDIVDMIRYGCFTFTAFMPRSESMPMFGAVLMFATASGFYFADVLRPPPYGKEAWTARKLSPVPSKS